MRQERQTNQMRLLLDAVKTGSDLATQGLQRSQLKQELQARQGMADALQMLRQPATRAVPGPGGKMTFQHTTVGATPEGRSLYQDQMLQNAAILAPNDIAKGYAEDVMFGGAQKRYAEIEKDKAQAALDRAQAAYYLAGGHQTPQKTPGEIAREKVASDLARIASTGGEIPAESGPLAEAIGFTTEKQPGFAIPSSIPIIGGLQIGGNRKITGFTDVTSNRGNAPAKSEKAPAEKITDWKQDPQVANIQRQYKEGKITRERATNLLVAIRKKYASKPG